MRSALFAVLLVVPLSSTSAYLTPAPLSAAEAQAWLRYTVPLPKEAEIRYALDLSPIDVCLDAPVGDGVIVAQAVAELREALQGAGDEGFRIKLQLGGPEAVPLGKLPNSEQAYRILPEPGMAGLRVVALEPRGLYYGAKTLCRLIAGRSRPGTLSMPILRVTDWPDMAERGLWGSDSFEHLRWLADRKLNVVEQISYVWVDDEGRGHGKMKPGREVMNQDGPRLGILPVPAVVHLNQLSGKGLFEAYPQLVAKGGDEGAVCFSQPVIVDVLADWIADLGSLSGVRDVDVWMTENLHGKGGCGCDACRRHDRNVLEAQVILQAWQKARQRLPEVGLRILTSEETYGSNDEILRMLPLEVGVVYYDSLLTYTAGREPMVDGLIAREAARGRWVGITPQLTGVVGPAAPFTGPQFVQYRMQEFVDKGLSSFTGYATPMLGHNLFNVEAAAEWSWNAHGRSPEEFARSYAVRRGGLDPDTFARWALLAGDVGWRLYGSDWPFGARRNVTRPLVKSIRTASLPELGHVQGGVWRFPWAEFRSPQELEQSVRDAQEAVRLAGELGDAAVLHESEYLEGCARALLAVWRLGRSIGKEGVKAGEGEQAAREMTAFVRGCRQAAEADRKWAHCIAPNAPFEPGSRYSQVVETLEKLAQEMAQLAAEIGMQAPQP